MLPIRPSSIAYEAAIFELSQSIRPNVRDRISAVDQIQRTFQDGRKLWSFRTCNRSR